MDGEIEVWLDSLPAPLSRHHDVLRALVTAVERDPRWRWLELSCSVARGTGDAESDLDLGLGIADDAWPAALAQVPALVAAGGHIVNALHHRLPEWGEVAHQRTFVQYRNGVQLDLVALPASRRRGRAPQSIVLYDRDGHRATAWTPASFRADASSVRTWAFLGWVALADLVKYLHRGSLWEALDRLDHARAYVWRL